MTDLIHQRQRSRDGEWYTPPEIFAALNFTFDLDPCSPGAHHWVPARRVYTKADDGLKQPWMGTVFVNPPYGVPRNAVAAWLRKLVEHGDGIALVGALTSSGWFQDWAPRFDGLLFPRGKTKFIRNGEVADSPAGGSVLLAIGETSVKVLRASGLGLYLEQPQ